MIRRASAWAASTYTGSFNSANAAIGVFVAMRRIVHVSRLVRVERHCRRIRTRAPPECVQAAAISVLALAREPAVVAVNHLPDAFRLRRHHARPADLAAQQARHGQRLVANLLGRQSLRAARAKSADCPDRSRSFSGVVRDDCRYAADITIVFASCLERPAVVHQFHRQPIEQFRMRRQHALRTEILAREHDASTEQLLPMPIGRHARRERVVAIDQPLGEAEPVARQVVVETPEILPACRL